MKSLFRFLVSSLTAVVGTLGVLWVVIEMNGQVPEAPEQEISDAVSFEVQPPEPVKARTTPAPTPPPKAAPPKLPPPPSLATGLGGLNFGLAGLTVDQGAAGSDLLEVDEDVVMTADTVDQAPRPTSRSAAPYPTRARAKGVEGQVVLSFLVTENGQVADIVVVQAEPPGVFDDTAKGSVQNWRFEPGQYKNQPVSVRVEYVLRFELS